MTDHLTGLMWTQNANLVGGASQWNAAVDYCAALSQGGHDDWRLPTLFELQSLLDLSTFGPAIASGHPFAGVQASRYWSSTTYVTPSTLAWVVDLNDGYCDRNSKTDNYYVWPVRGTATAGSVPLQSLTDSSTAVSAGYYAATNLTQVDTDLVSGNIRSGVTLFGVAGDPNVIDSSSGDATAGDLLSGKKAWVDGAELTGTMATRMLSDANDTVQAGYYAATTLSAVDTDLATANIKAGTTIFGVAGDANVVDTSTGDATAADIATGKKAWVDGGEVTGTASISAYPAAVPKTGQTTSYATGDDGDLEPGVAWPGTRFTDNGDGTVTDNLTGLIWLKDADAGDGTETWANALSLCNSLANGQQGLTDGSSAGDWRLPTVKELQSLIDFSRYWPALPWGHPFDNVQSFYWSSTTYGLTTDWKWYVILDRGEVDLDLQPNSKYVWPVRGP